MNPRGSKSRQITELEAQLAEARVEVEAWRGRFKAIVDEDQPDMAGNAVIRLRAEVERLRAEATANEAAHFEAGCANRLERERLEAKPKAVVEALEQIAEGAGPFSRDPLEHASNCIEAMKATALAALAAARENPKA